MQKVVLIGENIDHSHSPAIHNYLFERYSVPLQYELMPLEPEEITSTLRSMKRGGYRGANVTSPYKQLVIAELDEISDEAGEIGAVNTIVFEHGRAIGYNTDGFGFAWSLQGEPLIESSFTAAVLGTGGAAMAAVSELLRMSNLRSLVIYSRDKARAERSAAARRDSRVVGEALPSFSPADMVVHATPVGLPGVPGQLLSEEQLRGVKLLYEMVYFPSETALIRSARLAGARVVPGVRMLVGQAARAFELWTGIAVEPSDLPEELFIEMAGQV
jgi:shikimate dehydrogenase